MMFAWNPSAPHLPDLAVMTWALPISWALVLGVVTRGLALRLPNRWCWGLTWVVMVWTLSGGVWSPAYGLGLAFGSPSLMSAVLCVWALMRSWRGQPVGLINPAIVGKATLILTVTGVVLGWVLLFDTLAWWPQSVYAWGFGFAALAGITFVVLVVWMAGGNRPAGRRAVGLVALVLVLYVVTRLPTGNVWDALLDPWLWVILQITVLHKWYRTCTERVQGGCANRKLAALFER